MHATPRSTMLPTTQVAAYAALSLPLAMAALPVYVHVPKLYATLGLSLAWLGMIMLILRASDAVIDPWLGRVSDRLGSRKSMIVAAALPLAMGVWLTFSPRAGASLSALQWQLIAGLALTYFGFSAITIAYHAWGGEWSDDAHERTRIATWREGAGLLGVLIAAAIPVVLTDNMGATRGYGTFALIVVIVLVICSLITVFGAAQRIKIPTAQIGHSFSFLKSNVAFRRLLIVFAVNGIAAAIPATLFLFFADDVVKAADWQAQFLAVYFLAGALATPAWLAISKRVGKARAWLASMVLAIATFMWAYALGADSRIAFLTVCVLSGLALGADLTLPPSMLADVIDHDKSGNAAGAYFGVWTMVSKLNLALAAGIALPALAWLGYKPGSGANTQALSVAYAIFPCVLKALAVFFLWKWKDDETR